MEFKMERPGLVEPGQIVDVTEGVVAAYFYYTIEPAVAMSANYRSWQRLKSGQGKVIDVKQTPQGYYVVCVNLMKRMWNKEKEKSTGKNSI